MAIAPIDLQTMYANMNNVAHNVANQQQGAQLAQQMQESQFIQRNVEKSKSVHKAADNEAKSGQINDEGHQKQTFANGKGRKNSGNQSEEQEEQKPPEIRESYLGQHINIER